MTIDAAKAPLDYKARNDRKRKIHTIRMDSREHDDVTEALLKGMGYNVERHSYPVGDFSWDLQEGSYLATKGYTSVTVERKTLADIRDTKRLLRQLHNMTDPTVFYMVLIDHRLDTDIRRSWSDDALFNAEMSLQLGGVTTTHCSGGQVADRIHSLWQWTQRHHHRLSGDD